MKATSYCLPVNHDASEYRSSTGFCSSDNGKNFTHVADATTYEWADVSCKTQYTIVPVILIVLYLCSFSTGEYNSQQTHIHCKYLLYKCYRLCSSSLGPQRRVLPIMGKRSVCFHHDLCQLDFQLDHLLDLLEFVPGSHQIRSLLLVCSRHLRRLGHLLLCGPRNKGMLLG